MSDNVTWRNVFTCFNVMHVKYTKWGQYIDTVSSIVICVSKLFVCNKYITALFVGMWFMYQSVWFENESTDLESRNKRTSRRYQKDERKLHSDFYFLFNLFSSTMRTLFRSLCKVPLPRDILKCSYFDRKKNTFHVVVHICSCGYYLF